MRTLSLLALLSLAIGCGGGAPTSLALCHQVCDQARKCALANDAQTTNCHNDCELKKGSYSDSDVECDRMCTNCGDLRNMISNCVTNTCDVTGAVTCFTMVNDDCIKK